MRTHHGRDAFANWRWSSDAETVAHFRRWAELHTRLFPLWRALARQASETGAPILRPMAFFDPGDTRLHGIKDAYAIGDVLLVAPVVTASTSTRTVIFRAAAGSSSTLLRIRLTLRPGPARSFARCRSVRRRSTRAPAR